MPKRFTETDKWKDSWFLDLKPEEKLLFIYLCDQCDIAGFYERCDKMAAFQTGLTIEQLQGAYKGLARGLVAGAKHIWVRNFLKHQKNLPLNYHNPSHRGIIRILVDYAIAFKNHYKDILGVDENELIQMLGAIEGLQSPIGKGIGKGKGKGKSSKDRVKGKDAHYLTDAQFDELWELYPKKLGKDKAKEKAVDQIKNEDDYNNCVKAIGNYSASVKGRELQYVQYGSTFFNKNWKDWVNYKEENNAAKSKPTGFNRGDNTAGTVDSSKYDKAGIPD
jgi:hypothetical protein